MKSLKQMELPISLNTCFSREPPEEYVCYYSKILSEHLPKAVDLLSDIFLNSVFDHDEIEKERKVILQEIWMLKDTPDNYIHDLYYQNFWKNHPLGMSIIGSEESVSDLTRDVIVAAREDRFRADDVIITAAGKIEHDELLLLLNGLFAAVPKGSFKGQSIEPVYQKRVEAIDKDLEQIHLCLGTKALPQNHPSRYESYILNTVLGGSMSSRLFQEIRENQGLAYSVYSYITSHSDAGSMIVYAGTTQEQLMEVIAITKNQINKLKNEPVPPQELNLAKEHLKGSLLLSLEYSDNLMTRLAKDEIYFGRHTPIAEITSGIEQVDSEGLMHLSNELFVDDFFTLQVIGKLGDLPITPSILSL
jgi:predicted Zn-dependent peptidase